jgi:HlyD family secretion protein
VRSRARFLIPPAVILAIAVYVVWYLASHREAAPPGTIAASGTIEATEIDISPKVAGHILRLAVDEGSEVKAGQVIAILDGDELKAQVAQARGAYESAQARLADLLRGSREEQIRQARADLARAQAAVTGARRTLAIAREAYAKRTELQAQLVGAQTAYNAAQDAYKQAQARLALVEAGPRREQIEQARANVEQAKSQSVNAAQNAERAEQLNKSGAISGQQLDAAVAQRDAANAALAAAQARLSELEAGSRSEDIEQARAAAAQAKSQLDGAERTLATVKQLYADRLALSQQVETAQTQFNTASEQARAAKAQLDLLIAGPTSDAIAAARGQVEQARGALAAARAMTQYLKVTAPADGTVILKNVELGELVTAGMPIVRIANLDSVWVRVYVPEPEMRVKIGDRAEVVTDAFPGRAFPGRVTEVAEKPEFTPKNVQTKEERVKLVFGVKVEMKNPRHDLKPGMPADATIYTSEARGTGGRSSADGYVGQAAVDERGQRKQ